MFVPEFIYLIISIQYIYISHKKLILRELVELENFTTYIQINF